MSYVVNTDKDRKEMLAFLGISSIDELFRDLGDTKLDRPLSLRPAMSEYEVLGHTLSLSEKNIDLGHYACFLGAGAYNHFIPSLVSHIIGRSEFYTSYTPYQAETSQGMLQAIYEYQTLMARLTGMDVANASMYDGATALSEAAVMAVNITRKKEILFSSTIHPEYIEVLKLYCEPRGLKFVEVGSENGITSVSQLKQNISKDTAAVLVQTPNFFGQIEELDEVSKVCQENHALLVGSVVEATSLGLLKPPGDFGADIVVGELQSLGNHLSFGGPYVGFMATRKQYINKIPGRLSGATVDLDGNRGYILTLQAREQHIRRARAASNICTNQSLNALACLVYLTALGKSGFREVALNSAKKAHYLKKKITSLSGYEEVFPGPFYNEFAVSSQEEPSKLNAKLLERQIIGGLDLTKHKPSLRNAILFCATEVNRKEEIDRLLEVLGGVQ